jgi:hypothetical protein
LGAEQTFADGSFYGGELIGIPSRWADLRSNCGARSKVCSVALDIYLKEMRELKQYKRSVRQEVLAHEIKVSHLLDLRDGHTSPVDLYNTKYP